MSILSKAIYRFLCRPYQNPNDTPCRNRKIHVKIHLEFQRALNSYNNFEKREQKWTSHTSWFQVCHKATVVKIVWVWHKDNGMKLNGENPDNPPIYGQMIFRKGAKTIQWVKENLRTKWWWENWKSISERKKPDMYLISYTKLTQSGSET